MESKQGDPKSKMWLLGDSPPEKWKQFLKYPLDSKHPARHNIWTSVLNIIQDRVYHEKQLRLDESRLYIQNATANVRNKYSIKDGSKGSGALRNEMDNFTKLVSKNNPILIVTFGAFSFEFVRRVLENNGMYKYDNWGAKELGKEFKNRINGFDISTTNLIPLLHVSIARGKFLESHKYFCINTKYDNYFEYVGNEIAKVLLNHMLECRDIWVKTNKWEVQ